jgi:hypothetical protein
MAHSWKTSVPPDSEQKFYQVLKTIVFFLVKKTTGYDQANVNSNKVSKHCALFDTKSDGNIFVLIKNGHARIITTTEQSHCHVYVKHPKSCKQPMKKIGEMTVCTMGWSSRLVLTCRFFILKHSFAFSTVPMLSFPDLPKCGTFCLGHSVSYFFCLRSISQNRSKKAFLCSLEKIWTHFAEKRRNNRFS